MSWRELPLSSGARFEFPDGVRADLRGYPEADVTGLTATASNWTTLLPDVVDDGETSPEPRVFAVLGRPRDQVLFLGGPTAYRLTSSGALALRVPLLRLWEDSEYWATHLANVPGGILIVYEAGVLFLTPDLDVRWHVRKFFNDVLDGVEDDRIRMLRDHDQRWWILLSDGRTVLDPK